jgi:hypothetical protein
MTQKDNARLQLTPLYKLEILIRVPGRRIFHLLCNVFQKTSPAWRRTERRDVICAHLNPFICGQEETAAWDMVDVVEVVGGCYGYEVG